MQSVNYGIDLGTTNSLIAKFQNGQVTIFKNPVGLKETLPSVVAFRKERMLVGDKAREYLQKDAVNVFGGFKRKMGTNEKYYVVNKDENTTPIELSTLVLKELKNFVLDETVHAAVVTIPASFDSIQSNATKKAAMDAGLEEVFLLQEPLAASLAYFNNEQNKNQNGNWIVYDLGGGTFDVSLVKLQDGDFKVVDNEGNNFLGGMDFDQKIVEELIVPHLIEASGNKAFGEELFEKHGAYEQLYFLLHYKAEEAKKELSAQDATEVEFTATINGQTHDFYIQITRQQFNNCIQKHIQETVSFLRKLLTKNNLEPAFVQQIILVGGSTYIPLVKETLLREFGIPVNTSTDPTTAVAVGAAFYAANKSFSPKAEKIENAIQTEFADNLLEDIFDQLQITLAYSKATQETEEVVIARVENLPVGYSYRITRTDGGYDTGLAPLRERFTEFLSLVPKSSNIFYLKIYDIDKNELPRHAQNIEIAHGLFSIDGQPLPKDICIEVDDMENKTTKLEVLFERNSILPQKKTIYREISKKITKGSDDSVIINILEGDRNSRPSSNLAIGCIEISGKKISSDLLKGSDIEIAILMSESRELSCEVFLAVTRQEFKNVFSITEKQISIPRLKEQYRQLDKEIHQTLKVFSYNGDEIWGIQLQNLYGELKGMSNEVEKLTERNKSDKKYVLAESLKRISQEYDQIGGNERLQQLIDYYLDTKQGVETAVNMVDFEKDFLKKRLQTLASGAPQIVNSKNPSVIKNATDSLNELYRTALANTLSYLIARFEQMKTYPKEHFTNYSGATTIFKKGDAALENEQYPEFKVHVYNLSRLQVGSISHYKDSNDFKGTGIS